MSRVYVLGQNYNDLLRSSKIKHIYNFFYNKDDTNGKPAWHPPSRHPNHNISETPTETIRYMKQDKLDGFILEFIYD